MTKTATLAKVGSMWHLTMVDTGVTFANSDATVSRTIVSFRTKTSARNHARLHGYAL